ncbi:MAG: DUF11 domain-containing protein, partial [Anaerolineae bacterium]|nr:DUF11 domain-containing protein [Anaerolineae bacterium]
MDKGIRTLWRAIRVGMIVLLLASFPIPALAAPTAEVTGGAYSIDFSAARPNSYLRLTPGSIACPIGGRAADPLNGAQHLGGVESLAPAYLGLGQIVAFEFLINVNGSGPVGGNIQFVAGWDTLTTSNIDAGYDESYGVYCAFVDYVDGSAIELNDDASVDNISWAVVGSEIQGTFDVSGLDPNEQVVVEVWMVLEDEIPFTANGNVASRLISAKSLIDNSTINTGNQTIPLNKVQDFFSSPADISVVKSDPGTGAKLGGRFDYTLVVTNHSTEIVANDVDLIDTLDPNTAFVAVAVNDIEGAPTTCTEVSGTLSCDMGFLNPGEVVTVTVTVDVLPTAPTGFSVEDGPCSQDSPSADLCNTVTIDSINDNILDNQSDSEPTDVIVSDIVIVKTASETTILAGERVLYTYVVTNPGQDSVSAVSVVDDKCATVAFVSGDTDGDGLLDPGEAWTYTCQSTLTESTLNTATVSATDALGDTLTDQDTAFVEVIHTGIAIDKSTSTPVIYAGDIASYDYVVTNSGDYAISNVVVADDKCPEVAFVSGDTNDDGELDPGEIWAYACETVLAVDTLNTATVTGVDTLGNAVSDVDCAFVEVISPAIDIEAGAPSLAHAGDTLTYDVTVVNTGDTTLDVAVPLPDGTTWTYENLPAGVSVTFYPTATATTDPQEFTFVATGTDVLGGTVSDFDAVSTDLIAPAISIAATGPDIAHLGDTLTYSVTVTNET